MESTFIVKEPNKCVFILVSSQEKESITQGRYEKLKREQHYQEKSDFFFYLRMPYICYCCILFDTNLLFDLLHKTALRFLAFIERMDLDCCSA